MVMFLGIGECDIYKLGLFVVSKNLLYFIKGDFFMSQNRKERKVMQLKKKSASLVILVLMVLSLGGCNQKQNTSFPSATLTVEYKQQAAAASKTIQKVKNKIKKVTKVNDSSKKIGKTISLSIQCNTILAHKEDFDKEKLEVLPEDGVILEKEDIAYKDGETVFDALVKATKAHKIHMEYTGSKEYKTNYIEGIHNIYEFDCGPLSGWMYKVNGKFPNYGCSSYKLKAGDIVEWVYTCDLGKDVGAESITQSGESK